MGHINLALCGRQTYGGAMSKKPNTGGRPPLRPEERRNVAIRFRVTRAEAGLLENAEPDKTAGEFARETALRAAKRRNRAQ